MPLPQIGEVHDGYRYSGGDPNAKGSWSYVGAQAAPNLSDPSAPGSYLMAPGATPKLDPSTTKELAGLRAGATQAGSLLGDTRRFRSLNAKSDTGGIMGALGVRSLLAPMDSTASEMKAITERLVPQNREAGSGAMSDSDAAMYRAATVGLDKPKATNDAMSRVIGAASIRTADRSAFMEEWAKRNGSLLGAQEAWGEYSNANPLFGEKDGNTAVNGWTPWRTWFGVEQHKTGGQMAPKATPAPSAPPSSSGVRVYNPATGKLE